MDLNGDGHVDLLSGSWPGEFFFFEGGPEQTFAAPKMLAYGDGQIIGIGGGVEETDDEVLLTGNGDFEQDEDGNTVIVYHGKTIPIPKGKSAGITGTAASVHAADWDGDGDLDLIAGFIGGDLWLVPNEGTATAFSFGREQRLEAAGAAIDAPGGDAGPFVVDWDGDDDLDLLVGCGDGSVQWYRNAGSRTEPRLVTAVELLPATEQHYGDDAPAEPTRGSRCKVCATDWNGDGTLDLLAGDYAQLRTDTSNYGEDELAEHAKIRAEIDELQLEYGEYSRRTWGPGRETDEEKLKELRALQSGIRERISALRQKVPEESTTHGWVWLFLQATAESSPGK